MSSFGRFVVLIAVLFAGLLPAAAAADTPRSADFDDGWKFVLVNPTGITDPTGAYENAADPAYDDSGWRTVDVPHDWSIELDPTTAAGTSAGTGFLQGGLGWYRKTFTLPRVGGRQADLGRVRRRLHGLGHLPQRPAGRQPPVRLHRLQRRPHVARAHRRRDENVLAVKVQPPAAEQPLVLRQRHLPPRPSRGHRSGPRRAPRHVRDHAGRREHDRRRLRRRARRHDGRQPERQRPGVARHQTACSTRRGKVVGRTETGAAATCACADPHLWSIEDPYLYTLGPS